MCVGTYSALLKLLGIPALSHASCCWSLETYSSKPGMNTREHATARSNSIRSGKVSLSEGGIIATKNRPQAASATEQQQLGAQTLVR
ncbi:hypothetical protein FN846DRAFT_285225 [Sphaerosporella brunnea]|uniref:Secreted protein n=1 Tax=Sphaerosporella brunnea TaxID=1250544 RepID=A0A5J5EL56_9PEZI|nr:hypothetical protein FN846DRAFT_285225 [Sphaerosporella brunnea]